MMLFCAEVASMEIECYYHNRDIWFEPIEEENSTSCYSNTVKFLRPSPWKAVTKVNEYAAGNDQVKTIKVADVRNLNSIPSGIDKFFPNLIGILFIRCNILQVWQANFKPFPEIRCILLPQNQLEVLEKDLFEYNKKLEYLNFLVNNFKHIDAKILDNLHALTFINITCVGVQLASSSTKLAFENLFASECQNFEALQNHFDHILRQVLHLRLAEEIPKLRKQIEINIVVAKQMARLNKLRAYDFAKLLANFDKLSGEIQDLKERSRG